MSEHEDPQSGAQSIEERLTSLLGRANKAEDGSVRARGTKGAAKRGMQRRADWAPAYLSALIQIGMYTRAARAAGVAPSTVWERRRGDAVFAQLEEEAFKLSTLSLVEEAVRRAKEGVVRLKFGKDGKPVIDPRTGKAYEEREYSDRLLERLLSAHHEKFRERTDVTVKASVSLEPAQVLDAVRAMSPTLAGLGARKAGSN